MADDTPLGPDEEAEREAIAIGAAARLQSGTDWNDWLTIASRVEDGRRAALREAGTDRPFGRRYTKAFKAWLDQRSWMAPFRSDKALMSGLGWIIQNMDAVQAWRLTVPDKLRHRQNHPAVVKRSYEASLRPKPETAAPRGPKPATGDKAFEARVVEEADKRLREHVETVIAPQLAALEERARTAEEHAKIAEKKLAVAKGLIPHSLYRRLLAAVHPDRHPDGSQADLFAFLSDYRDAISMTSADEKAELAKLKRRADANEKMRQTQKQRERTASAAAS